MFIKYLHTLFALIIFNLAFCTGVFCRTAADSIYVAKYKADKQCAISYTFDDAHLEHYTLVFPKFEKLGFKATFWVNGKTIEDYEKGLPNHTPSRANSYFYTKNIDQIVLIVSCFKPLALNSLFGGCVFLEQV